jgi:DNA-directed RNA polymerase subunit alpha
MTQDPRTITIRSLAGDLSVRLYDALLKAQLETFGDVMQLSEMELLKIRNLGKVSLRELKAELADVGLTLRKR